jgi:hypothetical protein
LLITGSVGIALAAQEAESEVSVPKGIQDIASLIKQTAADSKSRDADIKLIAEKIADDASAQDKYVFYYLQAQAAERLGRIDLRINFLKRALEFAKLGTVQEFNTSPAAGFLGNSYSIGYLIMDVSNETCPINIRVCDTCCAVIKK